MKLLPCKEHDATHVQVLPDENNHCELLNVTPYGVYKILRSNEPGFEGEEMIKCDDGVHACSFSLVVYVRWMKEVSE